MKAKKPRLHPLLILLAVALVSVLFVVSCGGGATATAVPKVADETADTAGAEASAAAEAAETAAMAAEEAAAQAAAAAELAAVAEETAQLGAPKYGGTLTVTTAPDSFSLDPVIWYAIPDAMITQAAYDNLLMIGPDLSSLTPELATSWEANDDKSSYTLQLRQGVKFHHGKDFKAEDVLFTFSRLLDPKWDSPALLAHFRDIVDIVALDDYTVRFDLEGPNAFFLEYLSIELARILPADVDSDRLILEEFGTGPFMIEEYLPGERTTMVRNPDYWDERLPYLDELVFLLLPEVATRDAALKGGDVDVVFDLAPQSVPGIEAHPDTAVLVAPPSSALTLEMDNAVPPFDNKLVRQAFQAATDREIIVQAALLGLGAVSYDQSVTPDDPLFAPQYKPPDYDPDLARSLLEQAGYPDGIDVTLHTADVGAGLIDLAVAYKESAAPAGIRVEVQRVSAGSYWTEVWGTKPFVAANLYGRGSADWFLNEIYTTGSIWNTSHYVNPVHDALFFKARGQDFEGQKETYAEIQRIQIDDVPRLIIGWTPWIYGVRKNVRNAAPHPAWYAIFNEAWLDD